MRPQCKSCDHFELGKEKPPPSQIARIEAIRLKDEQIASDVRFANLLGKDLKALERHRVQMLSAQAVRRCSFIFLDLH